MRELTEFYKTIVSQAGCPGELLFFSIPSIAVTTQFFKIILLYAARKRQEKVNEAMGFHGFCAEKKIRQGAG